jgi:hypothetical protein
MIMFWRTYATGTETRMPTGALLTLEPKSLCNISGFCLIPQSFVKKLVDPACPPSQVSASPYSPRLMSEPGVFMPSLWRGRQFSAALMQRSLSYSNGQFL